MSYQFVVELPKHLETAYKAGKIVITGGVARYADGRTIAAHLEQVAPFALNAVGIANPNLAMLNMAFQTIQFGKGMVVDTAKLNQIIALTQQIKILSTVNLAISGVTCGIAIAGFSVVLHQLNKLDKKIDGLNRQIQKLDVKASNLQRNELSKLVEDVEQYIKRCITLVYQLEDLGWDRHLDTEIANLFDKVEALINRVLRKYLDRDDINVPLELTHYLYSSYANLVKAYLTSRYLHQKSLEHPASRVKTLEIFSAKLSSPDILDELYEEYLLNQERRFSEGELNIILDLYRCGCKNTSQEVTVHSEILNKVPLEEFKTWKKSLADIREPFVWIEHSTK